MEKKTSPSKSHETLAVWELPAGPVLQDPQQKPLTMADPAYTLLFLFLLLPAVPGLEHEVDRDLHQRPSRLLGAAGQHRASARRHHHQFGDGWGGEDIGTSPSRCCALPRGQHAGASLVKNTRLEGKKKKKRKKESLQTQEICVNCL